MVCRCGHSFCWECGADFSHHITNNVYCNPRRNEEIVSLKDDLPSSISEQTFALAVHHRDMRTQLRPMLRRWRHHFRMIVFRHLHSVARQQKTFMTVKSSAEYIAENLAREEKQFGEAVAILSEVTLMVHLIIHLQPATDTIH